MIYYLTLIKRELETILSAGKQSMTAGTCLRPVRVLTLAEVFQRDADNGNNRANQLEQDDHVFHVISRSIRLKPA